MAEPYRFRIAGPLSAELLATFHPLRADVDAESTVFVTDVRDQSELFGVLARCETLGLKLIGLDALDAPALCAPSRGTAADWVG